MRIEVEQGPSGFSLPARAQDDIGEIRAPAGRSADAFASDIYQFCAGEMIQLHEGIGFNWVHDAASLFQACGQHCLHGPVAALDPEQASRLIRLDAAA